MKKMILIRLLQQLRSNPQLKRKLMFVALAGAVVFVITSGLAIWAGVSAIRFASQHVQAINVSGTVQKVEEQLQTAPAITTVRCLEQAQNLLSLQKWLTIPIAENVSSLKLACLEASPQPCVGSNCQQKDPHSNTKDSEPII